MGLRPPVFTGSAQTIHTDRLQQECPARALHSAVHHPLNGPQPGRARPEDEYRSASRGERLQRVLADAGVASRRACEDLIKEGKVKVNGKVLTDLPLWVNPETDRILVNDRPIRPVVEPVYIMLNKPPRTLCAASDEPGADRLTVVDLVRHHSGARLFPVGRLDYDATGLLLMTNDGDMAHKLTHPKFGGLRAYEAAVVGVVPPRTLEELNRRLGSRKRSESEAPPVSIIGFEDGKTLLRITLRESRGRSVQDLLAKIGHHVKRLERIAFGPLLLRGIARGEWRELDRHEIVALKRGVTEPRELPDRPRTTAKAGKRKPRLSTRAARPSPSSVKRATGGPAASPETRSPPRPATKPSSKPASRPASRPPARPPARPAARPDSRPAAPRAGSRSGPGAGPRQGAPSRSPRSDRSGPGNGRGGPKPGFGPKNRAGSNRNRRKPE